ncbi:Ctr9p [Sugiyamaella lignohabitans]|uniref:Ctr9p n=1 Tax=Sugiyamaella lignohabitans TaxID=796027 RepID=A0A161HKJ1_9ASCO|nr:Ctr9p [Sugiyamaella lignohabitans]ANB13537.1 Ctr9p [Sugiyamaella lignohabitans]
MTEYVDEDTVMTDENYSGSSANILEIPLEADGEAVTIDLDNDLPENPSEICVLLENEKCAPEYWLAVGTAYARNGQTDNAIEVVMKGLAASVVQKDSDKLPFYSCLSWLYLRQLKAAPTSSSDNLVKTKEAYHSLATEASNRATQLDRGWSVNILARGALTSAVAQFDDSLSSFQTVLSQSNDGNLFAQLGRARVLYHKKNFKGALQVYQNVLLARPEMVKPDPRIGIGLCFWKLDDKEAALEAWNRAQELQPNSPTVNTLLGLYYMDAALSNIEAVDFAENYTKALMFIQQAYKYNPTYSAAGLALSTYFYSKKNMDAVLKLNNSVINYADLPILLSDGYFWMGRAYHSMNELDKALEFYQLANIKNPNSLLPLIGKGLVQMSNESTEAEALLTFENVVSNHPKSLEGLLLLGLLQAKRGNTPGSSDPKRIKQAITLLERYLSLAEESKETPATEALLILSQLYEPTNVEKALAIIKRVGENQGLEPGQPLDSVHLNNNIAVLYYLNGHYDLARQYFDGALSLAKDDSSNSNFIPTLTYNIARLEDAVGEPERAQDGYKKVLELAPDYLDARIRSTYLAIALSSEAGADDMTKLMDDHGDNLEVRSLYGWFLRRRKRTAAKSLSEDVEQKHYKHSLVDVDKHDSYSLVAMGNLYLKVAREIRINKNSDIEKKDKTYFRAAEFFDKALQIDPHNAFAAQGIAIIFAETKKPELASYIFTKIKETLNDISIYVNTGHCLVELRQFEKAIEAYEYALNRFKNGNDPQLMTLLGRAWYVRGMTNKDHTALKTALEYSKKALEQATDNTSLAFNVAFLQFQLAEYIRRAPESQRCVAEIEHVAEDLEKAIKSLDEIAKSKYPPFPANELEQRSLMGQNTLRKQLDRALAEQREYDNTVAVKLEEARKKQQEEKDRLMQEAERQAVEKAERERLLAEERIKLQEEAEKWAETARLEAEALKSTTVGESDTEDGNAEKKEEKKIRRKSTGSRQPKQKKPKAEKEKPKSSSKKFKSEDFIKDSSESELSDNELLSDINESDIEDDDRKRKPGEGNDDDGEPVDTGASSPKRRKLTKRIADSDEDEPAGDDLFGDEED